MRQFCVYLSFVKFFANSNNWNYNSGSKNCPNDLIFYLLYNQILFKLDDQGLVLKLWYRGLTYINLKTKYSVVIVIQAILYKMSKHWDGFLSYCTVSIKLFFLPVITMFSSQNLPRHHLKQATAYPSLRKQHHLNSVFLQWALQIAAYMSGLWEDTFDWDTSCRNGKIISSHSRNGWKFSGMNLE